MKKRKENRKKKKIKKNEVDQLKNQLARALADYDNLTKRVEREQEGFAKLANTGLIAKLLPIYDMLVQAQGHLNDSGLAITIEEFKNVFKEEGVEEIEVRVGDRFNEELFEAVEAVSPLAGEKKNGTVAEILLSGWRLAEGPVIRPVKVKVYRK